ncbi:MAG: ABC transporter ATP-binding protein [Pseudomonadota bacterium]
MINISGLTFDYQGHRALHQVSFSIEKGSVTALVGPNGAGKTTLMRCIAGLETPLLGTITVADINVMEHPREVHRMLGYLSDFFGLYQELTVAQCFEYAAASQGVPEHSIQQAIQTTAYQLEISDRLHQATGSLSRGLRQRVAIGQAIIHSPKVLLLDEPASGLDPEARFSLALLFRKLQAEGMTLLVSSHILAELDEYSSHMLALRDGRILDYRALGDQAQRHAEPFKRMMIALAQPDKTLGAHLSSHAGVVLKTNSATHAEFDFSGEPAEQAALLSSMIASGFSVMCFTEHKENLQDSYLSSLKSRLGDEHA